MRSQGTLAATGRARRRLGIPLVVLVAAVTAMTLGATGTASAAGGPTCPDGSTYNKKTKVCERLPTVVCPTDSTYDPATGLCAGNAGYSCVAGYTYTESGTCEASACAEGETYSGGVCITGVGAARRPECPAGPGGVLIEPVAGTCTYSPGPSCGPGLSYDAVRQKCVAVPQYTCPQGYGYNTLTGKCQTAPTKATKP